MSEKKVKDVEAKVEETKQPAPWKFGTAPLLVINVVREKRVYRFEMPIGAHLDECEEACKECVKIVNMMQEEAQRKIDEAKKEKKEKDTSVEEK